VTSRIARVLVIATILVTACTRGAPTAASRPTPSPSVGALAWIDCGGGFQCGTLMVPLDYTHPDARKIGISLIRKPATDSATRIGSLLINPGGPGVSGVQFVRNSAAGLANLNRRFDLIGFDPRGVGNSAPVTCVTPAQLDAYQALDSVLDDPQEKAAAIQADKDFAAACERQSGDLLPFVDTGSDARDMDLIRQAVGDAKLTYLGFSYGTFLGEWYAHLFPDHVRALSLDGVVDPAVPAEQANLPPVAAFQPPA